MKVVAGKRTGLPGRGEFRPVVDDPALPVGHDPAEDRPYLHADPHLVRVADDLAGEPGSFVQLDNGECIRSCLFELSLAVRMIVNVITVPFPANL
jgi:hypothetical protein